MCVERKDSFCIKIRNSTLKSLLRFQEAVSDQLSRKKGQSDTAVDVNERVAAWHVRCAGMLKVP